MVTATEIQAMLDAMSPDEREEFLKALTRTYGPERELLKDQRARGDALRTTPLPRSSYAGRATIAADPTQFIGAGLNRALGEYKVSKADKAREAINQSQQAATQRLMAELLRKQKMAPPANPAPPPLAPSNPYAVR